jgi:hypothetical protein
MTMNRNESDKGSANRDPITGAPGAHPVGTGLGAAAGGMAAGAAAGAVAGPIGAVAGAAVGAVVGGLAGKGIAENIDPTIEEAYWRENYRSRPYATKGDYTYDDYGPAYMYGVDNYSRYPGKTFDEVEGDLGRDWQRAKGKSRLAWDDAKHATKDSWHRLSDTIERATPGDSDRDGK